MELRRAIDINISFGTSKHAMEMVCSIDPNTPGCIGYLFLLM
jgi:hypothetical protein